MPNIAFSVVEQCALWRVLKQRTEQDSAYRAGVQEICEFALARAAAVRDIFPLYTRHDHVHIGNVLNLMGELLGDSVDKLNRDEAALLILSACCHDIGMTAGEGEVAALRSCNAEMRRYLDGKGREGEYLKAHPDGAEQTDITDELLRSYIRTNHHLRTGKLLNGMDWPTALDANLRRFLVFLCQSHGESCESIERTVPSSFPDTDLRLCAVLLRLADILDFDTSRAPQALYTYSGFDHAEGYEALFSKGEWDKHGVSRGFQFYRVMDRTRPYELPYSAEPRSMQVEQGIRGYLNWVDRELYDCSLLLREHSRRWNTLVLPARVSRSQIIPEGYVSGPYRFTLDQEQVLRLLGGEELYREPSVFVRELLQNAIDAVRTREKLDPHLPRGWKGQIRIRTWVDDEGYDWFRIEDNGIGMTREIIENHLLKVGSSYYNSDAFRKAKLDSGATDFTPISRFGIGLLSCFMGDPEHNRVEISTRHYVGDEPLRLRMDGLSGFYGMWSEAQYHSPGPMPGKAPAEQRAYRYEAGTAVAVRTCLYRTGTYTGFQEIVDRYLIYPPVAVRYDGEDGCKDYMTEAEFMEEIYRLDDQGEWVFPIPEEGLEELRAEYPEMDLSNPPKLVLKVVALDRYTASPYLTGACIVARVSGGIPPFLSRMFLGRTIYVQVDIFQLSRSDYMKFYFHFPESDFHDIVIPVIDLNTFPWYQRLFGCVWKATKRETLTVFNGVQCGNASYLCFRSESGSSALVLLHDQYRPSMSMARDGIQSLALEPLFDCELIQKQLFGRNFYRFSDAFVHYLVPTAKDCLSLLENKPDWVEQLSVDTNLGVLSLRELEEAIRKRPRIWLQNGSLPDYTGYKRHLYGHFLTACLQSRYTLLLERTPRLQTVWLTAEKPTRNSAAEALYPPALFLPTVNHDMNQFIWFYEDDSIHICNADHRLSQFLLQKGAELKKLSPGCFQRILSSLTRKDDEDKDDIITELNDVLKLLQHIPGNPLGVTDDLFLTDSDIYRA